MTFGGGARRGLRAVCWAGRRRFRVRVRGSVCRCRSSSGRRCRSRLRSRAPSITAWAICRDVTIAAGSTAYCWRGSPSSDGNIRPSWRPTEKRVRVGRSAQRAGSSAAGVPLLCRTAAAHEDDVVGAGANARPAPSTRATDAVSTEGARGHQGPYGRRRQRLLGEKPPRERAAGRRSRRRYDRGRRGSRD